MAADLEGVPDDARHWAATQFANLSLGDTRRTARAIQVATALAERPGASIPRLFARRYDVKAAYTFFGTPTVTPDALQAQHRALVAQALQQPGTYLLLADSSDLAWLGQRARATTAARGTVSRAGLGPIGPTLESLRGTCGFLLHSTVAVRWPTVVGPARGVASHARPPVEVLGVLDQQYYVRQRQPAAERDAASRMSRKHNDRARESHLWDRSVARVLEAVGGMIPAASRGTEASGPRYVYVADRGADIFEVVDALSPSRAAGVGFVIRACHDRAIEGYALPRQTMPTTVAAPVGDRAQESPPVPQSPPAPARQAHLLSLLRARAELDAPLEVFTVERRSRRPMAGAHPPLTLRAGSPARTVRLAVSAMRAAVRRPARPGHEAGAGAPVLLTALRVWEVDAAGRTVLPVAARRAVAKKRSTKRHSKPPDRQKPLEWVLLTDQEVTDAASAYDVIAQYTTRWLIEEFHKALKTGLGAERLQLETKERLFAAIAVMSVVATRLIALKEYVRTVPEQPASTSHVSATELTVLRLQFPDRQITTVRDVALAIGRLGGHLNRTRDGLPGWQTLWHGMRMLQALATGYTLAHHERIRIQARKRKYGES